MGLERSVDVKKYSFDSFTLHVVSSFTCRPQDSSTRCPVKLGRSFYNLHTKQIDVLFVNKDKTNPPTPHEETPAGHVTEQGRADIFFIVWTCQWAELPDDVTMMSLWWT